jgi:hypothetical protein
VGRHLNGLYRRATEGQGQVRYPSRWSIASPSTRILSHSTTPIRRRRSLMLSLMASFGYMGFPPPSLATGTPCLPAMYGVTSSRWRGLSSHEYSFQPQTDGQSEVVNKVIAMYIRCVTGDQLRAWVDWLSWAEYCYNTSFDTAFCTTPFELVYGRPPPPLTDTGHIRHHAIWLAHSAGHEGCSP